MASKYNGSVVVLDMGINGSYALNLLKKELSEETIVYINDLEISNYEGMEFYEIEKRIEYLIERVKKYSPKLLIIINDTLIEYGREMFDKLDVKKVYIVDEIIDYVNKNYELKNMAFFAPQGIIESNMYQKNFKYTRLYNLNADNVMESLNNALMKTSSSFREMKMALLPVYKKELDVVIPTLVNLLLFQTEMFEYIKGKDIDVIPLDKIVVQKAKELLNSESNEEIDKVKELKSKKLNIVVANNDEVKETFFKKHVFKENSELKKKLDKIITEKYQIIVEQAEN